MTAEIHTKPQEIPEEINEISFPNLVEAYTKSSEFSQYSPLTRKYYGRRLEVALEKLNNHQIFVIDSVAAHATTKKDEATFLVPHVRIPIRNAIRWANEKGLTEENFPLHPTQPKREKVSIEKRVHPKIELTKDIKRERAYRTKKWPAMSEETLESLFEVASIEHKAMFAVILSTRAPIDFVRNLTTDCIRTNANGEMLIKCYNKETAVDPQLSIYITNFLATTKSDLILAQTKNYKSDKKPISRQRIQQILDKYQTTLNSNEKMNYQLLVTTGRAKYGYLYYPKPQSLKP